MANQAAQAEASEPQEFSPAAYAAFIRQIELTAIWLAEAHVENHAGPTQPDRVSVNFTSEAGWEAAPNGFMAHHRYQATLAATDRVLAEIDVTFGLHFRSAEPLTDPLWDVFAEINLPVNTWPFLREFMATTTARMNWVPFTLPALKRGTEAPDRPRRSRPPRTAPPTAKPSATGRRKRSTPG